MEEQPDQTEPAAARQAQTQVMVNRTYPVPPYYYKAFTDAAWKAHKAQQQQQAVHQERGQIGESSGAASRAEGVDGKPEEEEEQPWNPFASGDQDDLSSRSRVLFEPPRVDWMIESGYWEAFGTSHALDIQPASEHQMNLPPFRPTDVELTDRQYLHLLLRSLLHTKLKLIEALTKTLRPAGQFAADTEEFWRDTGNRWTSEGEPYARHMHSLGLAMILVTNSLRDAQARLTMELMLEAQIERRREQTVEMKRKCADLTRRLQDLRSIKLTATQPSSISDPPDVDMDHKT